nr:hypothetical protein [Stenotrophomonas maltophilia]
MSKQYIVRSGSVPVDSVLPTFSDVFPSLVPPNKRQVVDTFDGVPAVTNLNGRSIPGDPAKGWIGTNAIKVSPDGYCSLMPPQGEARASVQSGISDGEWGATIENVADVGPSSAGLVFRQSPPTEPVSYWLARISFASQLVVLERRTAGSPAVDQVQAPLPSSVGDRHTLRVAAQGQNIKVYADGELRLVATSSALVGNTLSGLWWNNTNARVHEFVAGA